MRTFTKAVAGVVRLRCHLNSHEFSYVERISQAVVGVVRLPVVALALCATLGLASSLTAQVMQADGTGANGGAVEQASYTSSGSYFSRELGTPLRFGYHSEGYGTELGVVSLGTMKVFNLDGATWFLDAQGTMSDDFGGGFNAGIGYRELVNMSHAMDPDRILGASFWTDGQSTRSDNFFTQLGFGLESLGESFDLRMNGYFPLDRTKDSDPEIVDIDTIRFMDNGLFAGTQRITTDTAHSVIDAEYAKRLGNLDAWAIAGLYYLGGGGADDTGYKVGLRGYAVPDLLVGVQLYEDDIYDFNAMATITWFVGRTHKGNAPTGTIVDRFREPVMRNDYIATTSSTAEGAGIELTDADTDDFFNFIHVDGSAAVNGNGTFENPFNNLVSAEGAQAEGAYVYVHGGSVLAATETFTLQDNVKFWGEGTNEFGDVVQHQVDTVERGTVVLPETDPDNNSEDLDSPTINVAAAVDFLELADNNDVNNFRINGGQNAVFGNAVNAPQLHNLDINTPTGTGISLTDTTGTAFVENTVTITNAATGMHIDGGSAGMNLNARITDSTGTSLLVENRTGGIIAYGGSIQDNAADTDTATAIILQNNQDATVNFTQTIGTSDDGPLGIDVNSGNFRALSITGNDDGTTITFADLIATSSAPAVLDPGPPVVAGATVFMSERGTLTINNSDDESVIVSTGTGDAFHYEAGTATDADATITVAADINNSGGGRAVFVDGHEENNITFSGEITDADSNGIVLTNNTSGTIAFSDQVTISNTGTGNGVDISGGGEDVTYSFADIDIRLDSGTAFSVEGDGTLIVTSADGENFVQSDSGTAINLDGMTDGLTIGTGGAIFDTVNVVNGATNVNGVVLRDLDGAQVRIGPATGTTAAGTISTTGTGTGILIDDAANVSVNNVTLNAAGTGQGMLVINQQEIDVDTDATIAARRVTINASDTARGLVIGSVAPNLDGNTVTFSDLTVTAVDGDAVTVEDNTGGTYIFNDLTATTTGGGDAVFVDGNSDDTTVTFNDMALTSSALTSTGRGFVATNGGTIGVTGDTSVATRTGAGVFLNNVAIDAAGAQFDTVNVTNATVDAVNNPDGNAVVVRATDGTGTVTIGSGTTVGAGGTLTSAGAAILIDNADNVDVIRMTVSNGATAGDGLVVQNQDGGTVDVTGLTATTGSGAGINIHDNSAGTTNFASSTITVSGNGTGILVEDNTGGTNNFTGTNTVNAGTGTGVNLVNNSGATSNFANMNIDTTSGTGFTASGGGTVAVTGTSTVDTTTGTGVDLNGITSGGITFNSVNVDGAANGVIVNNVTGGSVTIGSAGSASALQNITGDAIQVTNSTLVNITNVDVTNATGNGLTASHTSGTANTLNITDLTIDAASGSGIVTTHTGAGAYTVNVDGSMVEAASTFGHAGAGAFTIAIDGSDFNDTVAINANGAGAADITADNSTFDTSGTDVAFQLALGTSLTQANVRVRSNMINSANAVGFDMDVDSNNSKTVNFLFTSNTVTNNSAAATAEYDANGATILNATVTSNVFNNAGGGVEYDMASNDGNTVVNLNLDNNTADGTAGTFTLRELGGSTFNIQNRDTVETRNFGNFTYDSPTNMLSDFGNIGSVPTPP